MSIEERYPTFAVYESAVKSAIDDMIAKRLMLQEDKAANLARLLKAGTATGAIPMETAAAPAATTTASK